MSDFGRAVELWGKTGTIERIKPGRRNQQSSLLIIVIFVLGIAIGWVLHG